MTVAPVRGRTGVWWLRSASSGTVTVHAVTGDERADGAVVDAGSLAPGRVVHGPRVARGSMHAESLQVVRVEVFGDPVAGAPGLVAVETVRRDVTPPTVEIVAFLHDDAVGRAAARGLRPVAVGTMLTAADMHRLGLTSADQVAAVRWVVGTGEVLELYVDPGFRRRRVAASLFFMAEACAVARGWPTLHAGPVRTAMGEALVRGWRWGVERYPRLRAVAPPMTPSGEERGRLRG